MQFRDEGLDRQDLRLPPSGGRQPVPVQVEPQVRAAVVAVHNTFFAVSEAEHVAEKVA